MRTSSYTSMPRSEADVYFLILASEIFPLAVKTTIVGAAVSGGMFAAVIVILIAVVAVFAEFVAEFEATIHSCLFGNHGQTINKPI